jgi:hypothetical protein
MSVKNGCVVTKSSCQSAWARVTKWKAINMGRDGPDGSRVKTALHREIFGVSCLQFMDRGYLLIALCSAGYGASAVARKVHIRLPE